MSLATQLAKVPTQLEVFCSLFGGPIFDGIRNAAGADADAYALPSTRMVFVPQSLDTFARTFPEVLAWKAPWLVFAVPDTDIKAGDVWSDATRSYTVTAPPVTHYGFVLGPANVWTGDTAAPAPSDGWSA